MPNQSCDHRQPQLHSRLGGCLAVSLLWLLALWNLGSANDLVGSDASRHDVVAAQNMPLHANSEYSLSLKRFFSRHKDQPKSAESPEPIWAATANEFVALLPLVAARLNNFAAQNPPTRLHQLQTLNISRAPPLV
jgi:hypothetical protein